MLGAIERGAKAVVESVEGVRTLARNGTEWGLGWEATSLWDRGKLLRKGVSPFCAEVFNVTLARNGTERA